MATQNSLFAIFHTTKPEIVEENLKHVTPWLFLAVEAGQWLLVAPLGTTTKEVSDRLGIIGGAAADGIVVRFDSYFGFSQPSVWEWLASKQGVTLGTATNA